MGSHFVAYKMSDDEVEFIHPLVAFTFSVLFPGVNNMEGRDLGGGERAGTVKDGMYFSFCGGLGREVKDVVDYRAWVWMWVVCTYEYRTR